MTREEAGRKAVVVTGAASGIGRASALLFSERGCAVVAADRAADGLAETARLAPVGGAIATVEADVVNPEAADRVVRRCVDLYGRLDSVVLAAGIGGSPSSVDAIPEEDWDEVVDVSLKGTYLCCRAAIPELRRSGGGAIVTFGSVLGRTVLPGVGAYSAAKAAVESLTRAIAIDHAREGIRANCLLPGSTDTPLMWAGIAEEELPSARDQAADEVPMGRLAEPLEIARAAFFLASEEASFITGASLVADGGILARASTTY
jgi:3-oxoacyl-[acyl-carrier protein] reductase